MNWFQIGWEDFVTGFFVYEMQYWYDILESISCCLETPYLTLLRVNLQV